MNSLNFPGVRNARGASHLVVPEPPMPSPPVEAPPKVRRRKATKPKVKPSDKDPIAAAKVAAVSLRAKALATPVVAPTNEPPAYLDEVPFFGADDGCGTVSYFDTED